MPAPPIATPLKSCGVDVATPRISAPCDTKMSEAASGTRWATGPPASRLLGGQNGYRNLFGADEAMPRTVGARLSRDAKPVLFRAYDALHVFAPSPTRIAHASGVEAAAPEISQSAASKHPAISASGWPHAVNP